jgi:UDP-glucose 4-epimerase
MTKPISPLNEDMPTGMPNNNYGYTKLIVEQMLQKLAQADALVDCFTSLF